MSDIGVGKIVEIEIVNLDVVFHIHLDDSGHTVKYEICDYHLTSSLNKHFPTMHEDGLRPLVGGWVNIFGQPDDETDCVVMEWLCSSDEFDAAYADRKKKLSPDRYNRIKKSLIISDLPTHLGQLYYGPIIGDAFHQVTNSN